MREWDKTLGQVVACREVGGLPASGVSRIRLCSLLSRFRCAGTLAIFVLVLCLLGIANARASETQLFYLEFYPHPDLSLDPSYRAKSFPDHDDYKFTFGGVEYRVHSVGTGGELVAGSIRSRTVIAISPKFPPDGEVARNFALRLGRRVDNGPYEEVASLSFADVFATESLTRPERHVSAWVPAGAYWQEWPTDERPVIRITGPETANNSLRLADYPWRPDENTGRLEIFDSTEGDDGQWKWICDDNFGEEEAQVACGQLGLPTDGAAVWEMPSDWLDINCSGLCALAKALLIAGLLNTPALLDDVDCDGDESRLIDCDHAGRGVSDCAVSEAVGVTCQEDSGDGSE